MLTGGADTWLPYTGKFRSRYRRRGSGTPFATWVRSTRLAPGFVVDTRLEAGARVVTFGSGVVARELIVDVDDDARRLVWAVVGGKMTHHNASLQVFADGAGRSRVVWIADLLPNELAGYIAGMIEQGMAVMKKTLELQPARA
jgi:hypothetical protein